jgi:hypothetical protein
MCVVIPHVLGLRGGGNVGISCDDGQKFTLVSSTLRDPLQFALRERSHQPNTPPHHSVYLVFALAKHTITVTNQDGYKKNCVREGGAGKR